MANNYTASHFNNNLYMEYKNSLVSTKTMQRKIFFQLVRNMPSPCLARASLELRGIEEREGGFK